MKVSLDELVDLLLDRIDGHRRDIIALNQELRVLRKELETERRRRLGHFDPERRVKKR